MKILLIVKLHNSNGPAIIYSDNSKIWCKDNKFHRINDLATEYENSDEE